MLRCIIFPRDEKLSQETNTEEPLVSYNIDFNLNYYS
jgi:hypothetical protein